MKSLFLFPFPVMLSVLISCNIAERPVEKQQAVEKTDSCRLDPKHTYEVWIPSGNNGAKKFPLLLILDAHGGGKSSLEKFKAAAGRYPAVLIASNFVKNGLPGYESVISMLIGDVREKYPVGKNIFIAGFSGGARMALGYALDHNADGLILCGALANAGQLNALKCPVFSISGMDDFNFIETAQYLFKEQPVPANPKIELTNASHTWPDSLTLANAFGFLFLSCQSADYPPPSKSQIKEYCRLQQTRIDSLEKKGEFLTAAQVARNLSATAPFNIDKSFTLLYKEIKAGPGYTDQIKKLERCLNIEMNARQPYLDAFTENDSLWWKKEISLIDGKAGPDQDPFMRDMYSRIRGFLGIACYSLGNQAVKEQNPEKLNKILAVYRLLEPDNSYILYLSAFPYYWKGDNATASAMLQKAVKAGFNDMALMNNSFPEIGFGENQK